MLEAPNPIASQSDRQTSSLKIPPHSIEAEQAVLGGLMLDGNAWDIIANLINEDDFYKANHKLIYRAMNNIININQPLDLITVSEKLESREELEQVGGISYLGELAKSIPTTANIAAYANIIRERSILRKLISTSGEIADMAFTPKERAAGDILDDAEKKIFSIAESGKSGKSDAPKPISSVLASTLDRIESLYESESAITGVPTGFTDFDKMTSGLQASDLVIVAGRPSMGKTIFAMNVAEFVAMKTDKPVLFFSMEMPAEQLAMRMLASLGRIELQRIRTGQLKDGDWPRLTSPITMLSEKNFFIDDSGSLSPFDIRAKARRVAREYGDLGLILVDYLQLMRVPGNNEHRAAEISEISRSLKALAKELNTPVIALSQLNRSLEQRTDRRPIMSDLRESGAIEQDADLIVFLYRDEVYNKETSDKGVAEIIIGKQRNGPIGTIRLTFFGHYAKFENFTQNSV